MATPDHDALRERYRIERDKRIRPDGNDQYLQPTGRYAHLLDDPYVERVERDPVRVDVDVAIIGGGFAGLCVGARLRERGVQDLRIIEGGGDVGGELKAAGIVVPGEGAGIEGRGHRAFRA